MGKGAQAPEAPDPWETAQAQASMNRVAEYSPYGNVQYGMVGENGEFVSGLAGKGDTAARMVSETDFQRQFREGNEGMALGFQSALLGEGIALPDRAQIGDADQYRQDYYDANVDMVTRDFGRDTERAETRLQNRGIPIGSAAFEDGMRPVQEAQASALTNLAAQAYSAGGQEQSRMFNLERTLRGDAMGEYSSLINGQAYTPSQLVSPGGISQVDIAGQINQNYQNELNAWNQQQANKRSLLGGILGIAGGFL